MCREGGGGFVILVAAERRINDIADAEEIVESIGLDDLAIIRERRVDGVIGLETFPAVRLNKKLFSTRPSRAYRAPSTYNGYVRQTALSSFAVANAARRLSV